MTDRDALEHAADHLTVLRSGLESIPTDAHVAHLYAVARRAEAAALAALTAESSP